MLKGTRAGILRGLHPVSVHGQLSVDVIFVYADDPEQRVHMARIGTEAVSDSPQPGDRVQLDFLMGVLTAVRRDSSDGPTS